MAWTYLLVASVFEVVFALATNATHGFTELGPSLLTAAAPPAASSFSAWL
ncbi:SMR family transporter [Catenulispora yoronensis]